MKSPLNKVHIISAFSRGGGGGGGGREGGRELASPVRKVGAAWVSKTM